MDANTIRAGMESRHRLGVEKVLAGWQQKDVADFLGVHPVTVGEWVRAHRAAGPAALAAKPHPGRKRFHPGYLREWLAQRQYSPQKPALRAKERDPDAVLDWLRGQWPELLKKRSPTSP